MKPGFYILETDKYNPTCNGKFTIAEFDGYDWWATASCDPLSEKPKKIICRIGLSKIRGDSLTDPCIELDCDVLQRCNGDKYYYELSYKER